MSGEQSARKRQRRMPEPIPDTPENIMKAILTTHPKRADEWRYLQEADDD